MEVFEPDANDPATPAGCFGRSAAHAAALAIVGEGRPAQGPARPSRRWLQAFLHLLGH